jgi:uncharacterized membrane protein YdjX (TVP38/TMEM64 family)
VEPGITNVRQLKEAIKAQFNLEFLPVLEFARLELKDSMTLDHYRIRHESVIRVHTYQAGNGPEQEGKPPTAQQRIPENEEQVSPQKYMAVGVVLLIAIFVLGYVYWSFPALTDDQKAKLKIPSNMDDAKMLAELLGQYTDTHSRTVFLGYCLTYIFLQTFSIPGSLFLSFLAGTLFGLLKGAPLVCLLSAIGATGAFSISKFLGKPFVTKLFPSQTIFFTQQINNNKDNLFFYFLFLRFSPLFPNVFVNMASPIVDVPLWIFFFGTMIGVSAQTLIAVRAGVTIQDIKDPKEVLNIWTFLSLFGLAFLALLPTLKPVQTFFLNFIRRHDHQQ